jgi:Domain of unknown function (DUF4281)
MTPDALFQWANNAAVLGWLLLLTGLLLQGRTVASSDQSASVGTVLWLGGRVIPVALCATYAACIALWWHNAPGNFRSLAGVASLFTTPGLLLAGWVHYLAFDLWLGRWQIDTLQNIIATQAFDSPGRVWVLRLLVVPCLVLTFVFGPVGLLLFLSLMRLYTLTIPRRFHTERTL